jgi:MFS family permease
LMVNLDVTVVNIALPSARGALGFPGADCPWIVTAYMPAFGGLLLLAARLADLVGRKRTLLPGLVGFAALCHRWRRAVRRRARRRARFRGVFGALLPPSALSLLTTTFTDLDERGKAVGVFVAIAVAGGGHRPAARRCAERVPVVALVPGHSLAIAIPTGLGAVARLRDQRFEQRLPAQLGHQRAGGQLVSQTPRRRPRRARTTRGGDERDPLGAAQRHVAALAERCP